MAPVETDSDNSMSARKNLCIVFFHSDGRKFQSRMGAWQHRDRLFSCERRKPQRRAEQKRWQMRPNLRRPHLEYRASRSQFIDINNHLILRHYFTVSFFVIDCCRRARPIATCWLMKLVEIRSVFEVAARNKPLADVDGVGYLAWRSLAARTGRPR